MTADTKKLILKWLPYGLIFYVFNQLSELFNAIDSESLIDHYSQLLMQLDKIYDC
ncbi:hypothetical protein [Fusibacter sp. 3D3]|uniref:hypothetical protein n=1 Tax=Fusibacter sp. 3D3 TaxID=1048380 RepID=UPI001586777E|nr:hypothetical protein [Fusibacter sp. 3D3]